MNFNIGQELIDLLRGKKFYMNIFSKKSMGIKKIKNLDTLILGSSHLECGYIASNNEFNMATTAQDLYYTYNLYKKYSRNDTKNIVIGYSYFSAFSHILKSSVHNKITPVIKIFSGIDYQDSDLVTNELRQYEKSAKFSSYMYIIRNLLIKNYYGNMNKKAYSDKFNEIDAKKIGEKICHAFFKHPHDQLVYLKKLIENIEENKQNLFIVLTPILKDYREYIPNKDTLFKELYDIISDKPCIKLIDYYDSEIFTKEDFVDYEHVNYQGAKKLTKLINDCVYSTSNP